MKAKLDSHLFITILLSILIINIAAAITVNAQTNYSIEWVIHEIRVMYDGSILINDTLKINGVPSEGILLGLPSEYGKYVLRCTAYNPENPAEKFDVVSGVPLGNRVDFYGVSIKVPLRGSPLTVSVVFLMSNSLIKQDAGNTNNYILEFPPYPSLITQASLCNASIVLPNYATYVNGTVEGLSYSRQPLPAYNNEHANLTFSLTADTMRLLEINAFHREIRVSGTGDLEVSDQYYIVSRSGQKIKTVRVVLLSNASSVSAEDEFGRKMESPEVTISNNRTYCRVNLRIPLDAGKSTKFIVRYTVPKELYLQKSDSNLELTIPVFKDIDYYVKQASITFTLPEGSKTVEFSWDNNPAVTKHNLSEGTYSQKGTVCTGGSFFMDSFKLRVIYQYNLLWLSFRPTLWVWALAVFGAVIAALATYRKPTTPKAPMVMKTTFVEITREDINFFIESYEEKRKILSELETLETGLRKGRIPRRVYKVRRKTLLTRIEAINKAIEDLKEKFKAAGGRYAELMREFEIAEAEVNEAEENLRDAEIRHRRGEISLEAYNRLVEEHQRKKENAETRIGGILVRLREEAG